MQQSAFHYSTVSFPLRLRKPHPLAASVERTLTVRKTAFVVFVAVTLIQCFRGLVLSQSSPCFCGPLVCSYTRVSCFSSVWALALIASCFCPHRRTSSPYFSPMLSGGVGLVLYPVISCQALKFSEQVQGIGFRCYFLHRRAISCQKPLGETRLPGPSCHRSSVQIGSKYQRRHHVTFQPLGSSDLRLSGRLPTLRRPLFISFFCDVSLLFAFTSRHYPFLWTAIFPCKTVRTQPRLVICASDLCLPGGGTSCHQSVSVRSYREGHDSFTGSNDSVTSNAHD